MGQCLINGANQTILNLTIVLETTPQWNWRKLIPGNLNSQGIY